MAPVCLSRLPRRILRTAPSKDASTAFRRDHQARLRQHVRHQRQGGVLLHSGSRQAHDRRRQDHYDCDLPLAALLSAAPTPVAVLPIRACATSTLASVGRITIHRQPIATTTAAATTIPRFWHRRSVSAPAGVCATTEARPIADIARPI